MDAASRQKRFAGDGKVKNKIRLPEDYRDRERIGPDKKINAVTVLGYRKSLEELYVQIHSLPHP